MSEKIAICIGHSRPGDNGAVSLGGQTEWDYMVKVAGLLADELAVEGLRCGIVSSYRGASYGSAMDWLAGHLKAEGCTVAVELHFNAFDGSASGFEYLHAACSTAGATLAQCFEKAHVATLGGTNRGVKAIERDGRGGGFLWKTPTISAILEPFFGDHAEDWEQFGADPMGPMILANSYAAALLMYCNGYSNG